MGTFIVLAVLLLAVGLAVGSMVRDKKNGKSLQCGGDCKYCHQKKELEGEEKHG